MEFVFSRVVSEAVSAGDPIVALESTVISHGLPQGVNLETVNKMRDAVTENGAIPSMIAVFGGNFHVGLDDADTEKLAIGKSIRKLSIRDLPVAAARGLDGATTVATTAFAARSVGIKVFATGGIGGVHRGSGYDVSADLPALAENPIIIVCSGAKAILDLPATREWLETHGITVLGFECDEMPAFYSRSSGLPVDDRVDSVEEIVKIANARDRIGLRKALLVTVPVPAEDEIPVDETEELIVRALEDAKKWDICGRDVTPFLLSRMSILSEERTLRSNVSLLINNSAIAARIAVSLSETP